MEALPTKITSIRLPSGVLVSTDILFLSQRLSGVKTIQEISLACNYLGNPGVARLYPILHTNPHITSLNLSCNRIGSKGIRNLGSVLPSLQKLQQLDLSFCSSNSVSTLQLIRCLFSCPSLKELHLDACQIDDLCLGTLGQLVKYCGLETLTIARNKFKLGGLKMFIEGLQKSNLRKLNIAQNKLNREGVELLFNFFKDFIPLVSLTVAKNNLDSHDLMELGIQFFRTNRTLRMLDIKHDFHSTFDSSDFNRTVGPLLKNNFSLIQLKTGVSLSRSIDKVLYENWGLRDTISQIKYPFYLTFHALLKVLVKEVSFLVKEMLCFLFLRDVTNRNDLDWEAGT